MKTIDVFYQAEGIREVEHIQIPGDGSFAALKAELIKKHGLHPDVLIFLEDFDEPIDEVVLIIEHIHSGGGKVHLHRCRHIEVDVSFNGETVHHRFGPGTTVARVKRWAAETKFKMSPEETSEHVLQIVKTHDRPAPGTHLGTLAHCHKYHIGFDLVPDERVNG
jgi:hypothetical protein